MSGEFSVYLFFPDETNIPGARWLSVEDAVQLAKACIERPAARVGMIRQVMITDSGDCCCFLWEFGKGITFPKEIV